MNLIELALWLIVGGLAGTALMDIVGEFWEQMKFTSGGRRKRSRHGWKASIGRGPWACLWRI